MKVNEISGEVLKGLPRGQGESSGFMEIDIISLRR